MLDLSAAFDVIDHNILLNRLDYAFGISRDALSWIKSYLVDRIQRVSINLDHSDDMQLKYGVLLTLSWGIGCIAYLQNQWERFAGVMECRIIVMQMTHKYIKYKKTTGDWGD
jgi:hypothetical protein